MSRFFAALLVAALIPVISSARAVDVVSPREKLKTTVTVDPTGRLVFSVTVGGRPVQLPSPVGIVVDGQDLGQNARLGAPKARIVNETYPMQGGHSAAVNQAREISIPVTGGAKVTPWILDVRAYDDGAAYRYRVLGSREHTINGESSTWIFPAGGTIWSQTSGSPDYEKAFMVAPLASLPTDQSIMSDCTIKLPGGLGYVMPTEANLVDYSGCRVLLQTPDRRPVKYFHDASEVIWADCRLPLITLIPHAKNRFLPAPGRLSGFLG